MTIQAEKYTGSDGQTYRVWRKDGGDTSPIHKMYPSGYNSKCGHCWAGHTHSTAAHDAELAGK